MAEDPELEAERRAITPGTTRSIKRTLCAYLLIRAAQRSTGPPADGGANVYSAMESDRHTGQRGTRSHPLVACHHTDAQPHLAVRSRLVRVIGPTARSIDDQIFVPSHERAIMER